MIFNFNKKGLDCKAENTKSSGRHQEEDFGKNADITELKIEDRKYSTEGHLSQPEIEKWVSSLAI